MAKLVPSASRKRGAPLNVIQITNIQQRMLGGYFEGLIMNKYKSFNDFENVFKYIQCDFRDARGFKIIILIVG